MGREATLAAFREKYPQYKDLSDDALGTSLAAKYPAYADLAPKAAAKTAPATEEPILPGAVKDVLGVSGRPGAVPLTGAPGTKTPLGVVLKPEGALERLTQAAVTTPAILAGGEALGVLGAPAALGRIAASGLIGGAEAKAQGRSFGYGALLDAIVAGMTEGAGTALMKAPKVGAEALADPIMRARAALRYATEAPDKALAGLRARLPKGAWLNVPSLSKSRLTVDDAVAKLAKMEGNAYQQARAEIASEMNRLDVQRVTGPKPLAGAVFKHETSPERFTPRSTALQRVAEQVATLPREQAAPLRAAWDTAMMEDVYGVPLGAIAGAALKEAPGALLRRIPGRELIPWASE